MIFSLLPVRRKSAALAAGLGIGAVCLAAIIWWRDVSWREAAALLLGVLLMLLAVMSAALAAVALFKGAGAALRRLRGGDDDG